MKLLIYLSIILITGCTFNKTDTVEFRGVNRQGIYSESELLNKWPVNGPELIMKTDGVGRGFSSPVLYNETIYVTGIKEDTVDVVSAYSLKGNLIWEKEYGHSWSGSYPDTRSTPTIEKNRIYLASGMGEVVSINAENGDILWSENAHENFQGEVRSWGIAESVLLTKKNVIYIVGGEETSVVAYNKDDGSLAWKSKSLGGKKAYSSPIIIERGGQIIILALTDTYLMGINPENGDFFWKYKIVQHFVGEFGKGAYTNPPLYNNGNIFVCSGYGHPGVMLNLAEDGMSVSLKWKNETLDPHHGGAVLVNENIYGSNWQNNSQGKWASINWETGKLNWETEWYNKGSVIFADEPSGNLDSANAEELHQLFFSLRKEYNQTIIIVTHNEELADMSDRKIVMRDGKIV